MRAGEAASARHSRRRGSEKKSAVPLPNANSFAALRDSAPVYVRSGSKADITVHWGHVRCTLESGHRFAPRL